VGHDRRNCPYVVKDIIDEAQRLNRHVVSAVL
jgi:hypothetical protein